MHKAGFDRTVVGNDGKKHVLPTGTYVSESYSTLDDAMKALNGVFAAIVFDGEFFVTNYTEWNGYNLKPSPQPPLPSLSALLRNF